MTDAGMLHLINRTLEEFGHMEACTDLPVLAKGCEFLANRRLVVVDDVQVALSAFIPAFTLATNGQARFLLHDRQSLIRLAEEVLQMRPYAVLIDGQLAGNARGTELACLMRKLGYKGFLVGFSSNAEVFQRSEVLDSVDTVVLKIYNRPEFVTFSVAQALQALEFRRRTN